MTKRCRPIAGLAAIAALGLSLSAEAATVFTDRAGFEAVAGPLAFETFDNEIDTATSITFDGGIMSTKSRTNTPPTLNRVRFGDYDGFVQRDGFLTITFDFGAGVTAFGADFSDLSSLAVNGTFDDMSSISVSDAIGGTSGFFGLVTDAPFSSVTFTTNAGVVLVPGSAPFGGEAFSVDNLATTAAVPLPAALPLMLGVITGAGLLVRRRQAKLGTTQSPFVA